MVDIRTVTAAELPAFRDLHNAYVDRDESLATVRDWYQVAPELCVGAFEGGTLVGHCLGRPRSESTVELAGIAVKRPHQRRGIGSALLSAFEDRAAKLGYDRVEVGSAGGYVDDFYYDRGYDPESVLVRLESDAGPPADATAAYDLRETRLENGQRHIYVEVDGLDAPPVEDVQAAFDDPEAIYIMSKPLGSRDPGSE